MDNIRDVLNAAYILKSQKLVNDSPSLVFFDFHKAYDTVPKSKLIIKLEQMKVLCNIIKLVSNMLCNFILKVDQETIHTKADLIQGSVLSPILFNIFLKKIYSEHMSKKKSQREPMQTTSYESEAV